MPQLIVLHKLGNYLAAYDVSSGRERWRAPTGPFPHEICAAPDGRRLYVTEYGLRGVESEGAGGNTVGVYDVAARERIATIKTGAYLRPHGVAAWGAGAAGRLFVTSETSERLLIFRLDSGELLHAVAVHQRLPHITAVSSDGRTAYTANIGSGSLTAIEVNEGRVRAQIEVLDRPEGMAFSPDGGWLYVVNRESRAVAVVETRARRMVGKIETGGGPVRLAITPDGARLVFPLFFDDSLQIADARARRVIATIPVGRQPAGTTISPDGETVFVSCELERAVYVVSLAEERVVGRISTGDGPDSMVCLPGD